MSIVAIVFVVVDVVVIVVRFIYLVNVRNVGVFLPIAAFFITYDCLRHVKRCKISQLGAFVLFQT